MTYIKGHKHSKEVKDKQRLGRLGYKMSDESKVKVSLTHKGNIPWNKGKTGNYSDKSRKKMSDAKKGDKSPLWKGGISTVNQMIRASLEYRLWREAVFKRDNWTCIWCGKKGTVNADHIKRFADFPELRFAIDNGRTLCVSCHKTTGTWGRVSRQSEMI